MITTKEIKKIADKIINENNGVEMTSDSMLIQRGKEIGLKKLVTHLENAENNKRNVIVWKDRTATYWDDGEIVTTELWKLKDDN
jgi:hypothetical protein